VAVTEYVSTARSTRRQHFTSDARVRRAAGRAVFSHQLTKVVVPGLLFVTLIGTLLGGPKMIIIPTVVAILGWAAFVLPLETVVPAVAFLLISVNNPSGQPALDEVDWFLNPVGAFLYENLPTKFALADVLIGLLVFRAATVLLLSERDEGLDRRPPRPFAQACLLAVVAIIGLEFWGVFVNGGDFQQSLWQLRVPLLVPCLALAVSVAASDFGIRRIRFALLAAGAVKAIEAIYISYVVGFTANTSGAYVTTHSDTMIWVTCLFILIATWFETRSSADLKLLLFLAPLYFTAIVANNRRLAFVSLIGGILFIIAVAHRPVKRQLGRYLRLFWPLLVVYVGVGFASHSTSPIFLPVSKIASVSTKKDASTDTRDIENFNLLVTLKEKPLFGYGFGHPYNEFVVAYSVEDAFKQYRFLPHNSFLGFWALNGVFGPSLYFLLPVVAVFYAVSCRRRSRDPARRAAAAWSVCVVIAYLVQSWADLGMQDWQALVCVGIAYGISGSLGRAVISESLPPKPKRIFEYVEESAPPALRQADAVFDHDREHVIETSAHLDPKAIDRIMEGTATKGA
jgi:hypothetical protein